MNPSTPWLFNLLNRRGVREQKKLAVLIDAENISPSDIGVILDEVAKYGVANIKRIYGDWTKPQMNSWKGKLHAYSIQPIQQFTYTSGKNSSDAAMIIDAMDILHSRNTDGFCIVSSDSDYTRLATRIRESGKIVYGFGEKKTPEAFTQACDVFIFIENLKDLQKTVEELAIQIKLEESERELESFLRRAVGDVSDENGWANLSDVGNVIRNRKPEFDYREYGSSRLSDLFEAIGAFDFDRDSIQGVRVRYRRQRNNT